MQQVASFRAASFAVASFFVFCFHFLFLVFLQEAPSHQWGLLGPVDDFQVSKMQAPEFYQDGRIVWVRLPGCGVMELCGHRQSNAVS